MSTLQSSLAQAGKLKQFCQAVLDVVGAAEQLGPLEQAIAETQARLIVHQDTEATLKARLADVQVQIDHATATAAHLLATAKQAAELHRHETTQTIATMMAEAKQAVRLSYDAKAKLDAEVVAQHQELTTLKTETQAQEQKLVEAKAAIERMLR